MGKKAIIAIDLAAAVGSMRFVPGTPLPRRDKQRLERQSHGLILDVALYIDKKHVFPAAFAGRPGFNTAHVDVVLRKRFQQMMQQSGAFRAGQ